MLNVNLIGNLGADAQIKNKNGQNFLAFNVAHTSYVNKSNGERTEVTQWVSVSMSHYSDKLASYLKKGQKVYVTGKLYTKIWFDINNKPNVGLNVLADMLELCGGVKLEQDKTNNTDNESNLPF